MGLRFGSWTCVLRAPRSASQPAPDPTPSVGLPRRHPPPLPSARLRPRPQVPAPSPTPSAGRTALGRRPRPTAREGAPSEAPHIPRPPPPDAAVPKRLRVGGGGLGGPEAPGTLQCGAAPNDTRDPSPMESVEGEDWIALDRISVPQASGVYWHELRFGWVVVRADQDVEVHPNDDHSPREGP